MKPGKYCDYHGNEYQLFALAMNPETQEPTVIYHPLGQDDKLLVCPVSAWEGSVTVNGISKPRFTYVSMPYTNDLSRLWYEGDASDWEQALEHYHTLYQDADLEREMEELQWESVEQKRDWEFYTFLKEKYFVWKYTAKNRLGSTLKQLKFYEESGQRGELDAIQSKIFSSDRTDISAMLQVTGQIRGLGIAGASGLLSILFPELYGTVDQFVVKSLSLIDDLPEHDAVSKMNPEALTLKNGVLLEEILRRKAKDLNRAFGTQAWTPRKIDMVLWSFGR